ncbi:MAG: hypothetical protein MZV64_71820 [Ignavibacteriales bacterium]|nr:hypothetical protein [Ignavibacteriales bacterium]
MSKDATLTLDAAMAQGQRSDVPDQPGVAIHRPPDRHRRDARQRRVHPVQNAQKPQHRHGTVRHGC